MKDLHQRRKPLEQWCQGRRALGTLKSEVWNAERRIQGQCPGSRDLQGVPGSSSANNLYQLKFASDEISIYYMYIYIYIYTYGPVPRPRPPSALGKETKQRFEQNGLKQPGTKSRSQKVGTCSSSDPKLKQEGEPA